jgi:hypothetical protein
MARVTVRSITAAEIGSAVVVGVAVDVALGAAVGAGAGVGVAITAVLSVTARSVKIARAANLMSCLKI